MQGRGSSFAPPVQLYSHHYSNNAICHDQQLFVTKRAQQGHDSIITVIGCPGAAAGDCGGGHWTIQPPMERTSRSGCQVTPLQANLTSPSALSASVPALISLVQCSTMCDAQTCSVLCIILLVCTTMFCSTCLDQMQVQDTAVLSNCLSFMQCHYLQVQGGL